METEYWASSQLFNRGGKTSEVCSCGCFFLDFFCQGLVQHLFSYNRLVRTAMVMTHFVCFFNNCLLFHGACQARRSERFNILFNCLWSTFCNHANKYLFLYYQTVEKGRNKKPKPKSNPKSKPKLMEVNPLCIELPFFKIFFSPIFFSFYFIYYYFSFI